MDWNGFWSIDLSEWCALKYRKCMTQIRPNMSLECSFTFLTMFPCSWLLMTIHDGCCPTKCWASVLQASLHASFGPVQSGWHLHAMQHELLSVCFQMSCGMQQAGTSPTHSAGHCTWAAPSMPCSVSCSLSASASASPSQVLPTPQQKLQYCSYLQKMEDLARMHFDSNLVLSSIPWNHPMIRVAIPHDLFLVLLFFHVCPLEAAAANPFQLCKSLLCVKASVCKSFSVQMLALWKNLLCVKSSLRRSLSLCKSLMWSFSV